MTIRCDTADGVLTVTIDRPEKKNAVSLEMREQIWIAFEAAAEDDAVRAIILAGGGNDFCAGMDVGEMGDGGVSHSLMKIRRLHRITRAIAGIKKPVIAAVDGVCVGAGWSFALACDIVIATPRARFAQIFRNIGLAPDAGAVWQLRQQLGAMRAKEIAYSGRMVSAEEASALGLVLELVEPDALRARAIALARSFSEGPTLALGMAKRQFEAASAMTLDQFLELECTMQPLMSRSEDHKEGVNAFKERRPPNFSGR